MCVMSWYVCQIIMEAIKYDGTTTDRIPSTSCLVAMMTFIYPSANPSFFLPTNLSNIFHLLYPPPFFYLPLFLCVSISLEIYFTIIISINNHSGYLHTSGRKRLFFLCFFLSFFVFRCCRE